MADFNVCEEAWSHVDTGRGYPIRKSCQSHVGVVEPVQSLSQVAHPRSSETAMTRPVVTSRMTMGHTRSHSLHVHPGRLSTSELGTGLAGSAPGCRSTSLPGQDLNSQGTLSQPAAHGTTHQSLPHFCLLGTWPRIWLCLGPEPGCSCAQMDAWTNRVVLPRLSPPKLRLRQPFRPTFLLVRRCCRKDPVAQTLPGWSSRTRALFCKEAGFLQTSVKKSRCSCCRCRERAGRETA